MSKSFDYDGVEKSTDGPTFFPFVDSANKAIMTKKKDNKMRQLHVCITWSELRIDRGKFLC